MTQQHRLRSTFRRWFWLVALGTIVGGLVTLAVTFAIPPGYTARVTILVAPTTEGPTITSSDLLVAQALATTFAELATTGPVLDEVIEATGVSDDHDELARAISTRVPTGTSLLEISVGQDVAADAAAVANALAGSLLEYRAPGQSSASPVLGVGSAVVDPAVVPAQRDGPGLLVRTGIGAAIAFFLTLCLVILVENISPRAGEPMPSTGRPSADVGAGTTWPDSTSPTSDAGSAALPFDPLASPGIGASARSAARGVINDLEVGRGRPSE